MNYFAIFTDVLMRPSEFFKKMPREDNLLHALIFCIVLLLITALTGHFFESSYLMKIIKIPGPIFIAEILHVSTTSLLFIISFILSFKLLGGKDNWLDTFKIIAYSTAVLPLQFLPIFPINAMMSIYWIHVCIRGGQFVHNMSYWKSFLIVLLGLSVIPFLLSSLIVEIIFSL